MGNGLVNFIYRLSRFMQVIAGIALVFMMSLTTCDVILRIFSRPIIGTYEMVAFTGGVVIGFSLPITSFVRGQIFVDFFYQKFPKFWQNVLNVATRLVSMVLFLFIGANLMILASDMVKSGEVSLDPAASVLPDCIRDRHLLLRPVSCADRGPDKDRRRPI